ncbi:MAG: serpin family protein [Thermoplasmata archaeon]|nr:MAG: serpin family protein [Thermoplasmata archaeon]
MGRRDVVWVVGMMCVVVVVVLGVLFYPLMTTSAVPFAVDTYATEESVSQLSDAMNSFSFRLYRQLCSDDDFVGGNVFFSPYSVFVVLAMAYEGAYGETAVEMQDVLGFPQNNETSLCSFGRIYNLLNHNMQGYVLSTANALWVQRGYPFLDGYLDFVEKYYMGKAADVDFGDADRTVQLINRWVSDHTGGRIRDLLSSGDVGPLTKMVLTNAVYFKGDWMYCFDADKTREADFEVFPGNIVSVPMMYLDGAHVDLNYSESDEMQILELPYRAGKVSMIILLPRDKNISRLESRLSYENFSDWMHSMSQKKNVQVRIPRFEFETESFSLKKCLIGMGMENPFSSMNADFSGMTGMRGLYIEDVVHKGFVQVDERGTEAAAATAGNVALTGMPKIIKFTADHPFIFLIQHKDTGVVLFMGKMMNPK